MRLIDADGLKEYVKKVEDYDSAYTICAYIDNAPTVEKPRGKWITKTISTFPQYQPNEYMCPFCRAIKYQKSAFCPNCGAQLTDM